MDNANTGFTNTNSVDTTSNSLAEAGSGGSNTNPRDLEVVHDKIKQQYDDNDRRTKKKNLFYSIYSEKYAESFRINDHDRAVLHSHLLSLDRDYDLRLDPQSDKFIMYPSRTSLNSIKPSLKLLSLIKK